MKKINRNFFKPFMFICVGLMAIMLMSATRLSDPPGKPRNVEIMDYGRDWCIISFKAPRSDGGAPISKYLVDKKYRGERWERAAEGLAYAIKVSDLKEGYKVEFRVSAVNEAGEGMPSDPTKPHVVKDR